MNDQQYPLLEFDHSQGLSYINNHEHDLRSLLYDDIQDGFIQDSFIQNGFIQDGFIPMDSIDIDNFLPEISFESNQSNTGHNYSFEIIYLNFPTVFYKKQVRKNNRSMQRIENGKINFLLDFGKEQAFFPSIPSVSVKVKRTTIEKSSEVQISCHYDVLQKTKLSVHLDLDTVYEDADGYKVYELEKCLHSDLKKFHLIIEVRFANNYIVTKNTHSFTLTGRKRKQNDEKRQKMSSCEKGSASLSEKSSEFLFDASSSSISSLFSKFQDNEKVIKCSKLVAQHIETKSLHAGDLKLDNPIKTSNGDIAYNWPLENLDDHFEEGEVVGFIADTKGKYVLTKLTLQNCKDALLKGVISRSYYLEARTPNDGRRSETICFMGIVPVQVKGSVCINDALYASPNHPGFAVSGYHFKEKEIRGAALIGYAFASQIVDNELAEGMVQAGVSVLETVSQCLHDARLQKLEESIEEKLDAVKYVYKKTRKCTYICFAAIILMFVLTSILLFQIFFPGSSLRNAICSFGSLNGHSNFFFMRDTDFINTENVVKVNGIEFDFKTLKKKTSKPWYKEINGNLTDFRYYLNIEKCAFSSIADDKSLYYDVYGPDEFAVNKNCTQIYYYDDINEIWSLYGIARAISCSN